jgi:hypothetical protein
MDWLLFLKITGLIYLLWYLLNIARDLIFAKRIEAEDNSEIIDLEKMLSEENTEVPKEANAVESESQPILIDIHENIYLDTITSPKQKEVKIENPLDELLLEEDEDIEGISHDPVEGQLEMEFANILNQGRQAGEKAYQTVMAR